MNERLLHEIKKAIETSEPAPGYPSERFVVDTSRIDPREALTIPSGPWDVNNDALPSEAQASAFSAAGYEIDALGRPLHPGLLEMVTDPNVGVVSGRGRYYHWGPNKTADPIVITTIGQPRVLLIKRGDTGTWALPGGFVDPSDRDTASAALRELQEETGLSVDAEPIHVYHGVVGDRRTTAHAWAETGAFLLQVERPLPVAGNDDATDAKWVRLDDLRDRLFGSHNYLIEEALKKASFTPKTPIYETLERPKSELDVTVVEAGHMAYDHLLVRHDDATLFVKAHKPSRFTDEKREAHSRAYLLKEHALYEHVAERGFQFIPERVDLVEDRLLAMDALHTDEGWLWRAPKSALFNRYATETLDAFAQLQSIPVPAEPAYHAHIEKTHATFWHEGWDVIDEHHIEKIRARMTELSAHWTPEFISAAERLSDALPELLERSASLDRTPALFMSHNDARQSNVAWHPERGVRIVDWSWGDPSPFHADETMFLIDLKKAGRDVMPYLDRINQDHVVTLIGFWLAHSLWRTHDGGTTVREQQVASAVAAYELLGLLPQER
jgi:ADP-ribose pyrophosphatase YjhB (NUDIX family)